jgi:hypothetical protein
VRAGHSVANREIRSDEDRPIPEARELGSGCGKRGGVPVEPEEATCGRASLEDRRGVPARADRPVEIAAGVAGIKLGE